MTQIVPDVISDARVRVLQLLSPLLVRDEVVIDSRECRAMSSDVYAAGDEGRLRSRMVQLFAEFGAASNQIGKTYPYLDSLSLTIGAHAGAIRALRLAQPACGLECYRRVRRVHRKARHGCDRPLEHQACPAHVAYAPSPARRSGR